MPGVLTLIRTLEERGFTVEAAGDRVRVRPPKPEAVEEARDLLDELRRRKAEVLAALRGCPTCGASAAELDEVRRKRALDEALAGYERHLRGCGECAPDRLRFCAEGDRLREEYFDAWLGYHGGQGRWDPWRG